MPSATTPLVEANRMEELYALQLLDTSSEPEFDNLALLASEICDVPTALISFVHQEQVWFKSRVGFDDAQALWVQAVCRQTVEDVAPTVMEDTVTDPRFQNDEYVPTPQSIRFFAGVPLVLASGFAIGCLCVIDHKARALTSKQLSSFQRLAGQVLALVEARRAHLRLLTQEKNRLVSEQRLDFALAAADIGDWDMDLRTNVARRSLLHDQCFGYTEPVPAWGYDTFLAHISEEDRPRVDECYQRAMAGKGAYDVEFRVVWPDRSVHWLWSKGRFYFDDHGKPYRVAGIQVDITDRKQVESALQVSNQQLQLLETCVSRLNDIVLITEAEPYDQPGPHIVFVNDAFVRRTGYSREEVIGQTPRILQGEKTQRDELDRIRAALKRWEPVRSELINYTKAGEEFWLEMDIVPVADASGWYTHWVAVERDITHRKLAEVTVLESEMRHRSMFENNPQPMWVYDCETLAFLSVNDATVAQYGYSREELQHMNLRDLLPAEDRPKLDARLAIDLQSRTATAQVWTNLRKDSTKIQVEVSAHAMEFQGRSARLVLVHDITERLQSEAKVHHLAFHDLLTGLPNRGQFLNYTNQVLQKGNPASGISVCILLDLDNFKRINDHWGHPCGDELLKQVALRVQQCLPPSGFVARLGGDEFIVLVTTIGADQDSAAVAAQGLCSKILVALARGFLIDKREHFTSASLGIALFGDIPITVVDLLSRADSAMYSAKADGRNAFRFFDGQLQAQLAAQSELEDDLRQCIQNAELHLVYQPQVDHLGHLVGAEALLRWTHPTRGLVSPAQFIPAAENSGFILQIGQWVLHTACRDLKEWQFSEATAGLPVAVNVSAKQFHHPDFVSQVLSALEIAGANPALLKLELTESLLAQDLDGIVQKMNTLKVRGVTFSLDDFGTGYSSLAYLKRLPLDQLKIDQGFVRDVLVNSSDAAIVRTVIALGDRLGLNVIAEGVETLAQKGFLEFNCCYYYQGYLFSRPLKKEDFEAFCAETRNHKEFFARVCGPNSFTKTSMGPE
jgi:diguanylate cyclase (GGDEF)-like protein/PAS domain S-box-containing protein